MEKFLINISLVFENLIIDGFYFLYNYVIICCIDGILLYWFKLMIMVILILMYI